VVNAKPNDEDFTVSAKTGQPETTAYLPDNTAAKQTEMQNPTLKPEPDPNTTPKEPATTKAGGKQHLIKTKPCCR